MLLQFEGFDHYGAGALNTASTVQSIYFVSNKFALPTHAISTAAGYAKKTGGMGVRLTSALNSVLPENARWIEKSVMPEGYASQLPWSDWERFIFFRFAFRFVIAPSGRLVIFTCGDMEISVGSDWFIYVKRGSANEVNTGYEIELNIWNFIEVEFNEEDELFRLWMNDIAVFEIEDYEVPTLDKYSIRAHYRTGGAAHAILDVDDFSMNDGSGDINNDRLGKTYVQTRWPTADDERGFSTSTANSATNYTMVNEATPNNDTNYVYSNTPDTVDLYKNPTAINAIDDMAICAVAVIPAGRMVEPDSLAITGVIKSDGVTSEGYRQTLKAATYTSGKHIFEVDPATGQRWIPADVEAASFGVKIVDRE